MNDPNNHWRQFKRDGRFHWCRYMHGGGWNQLPTYKTVCGKWFGTRQDLTTEDEYPASGVCPDCQRAIDKGTKL